MRYGLIILALTLVLVGCEKPTQPEPEPPKSGPEVKAPPPVAEARTMTVRPLTLKSARDVDPALTAALDAAFRSVLEQTRHYVLAEENADLVLTPRLEVFNLREVGGGGRFTMRDLGLDPGPEYAEGEVRLLATLGMGGEEITETVDAHVRGGDGTPGVFREDRDRDGRLELHITPEGAAALLRPAMQQLAGKLMARTHPAPEPATAPEK